MRRTALTLLATLVLMLAMAMSTVVASAGWTWEDCPPASAVSRESRSTSASEAVKLVNPPTSASALWDNPGKKFPVPVE